MLRKLRTNLRVRDPVHGFIPFTEVERDVIGTRAVQRLRGVSQLALTSLAYPGARHSRFEHSLGVMHVAGRIAEKVDLNTRDIRRIRLAALLHDIGHGPFSHVSDVPMAVLTAEEGAVPKGVRQDKLHEQLAVELIRRDAALRKAIRSKSDTRWIIDTLDPTNEHPPLPIGKQIVAGALDADKLDYLLRDGLMAGVQYGAIDLERVIDCCTVLGGENLAFYYYGVPAVEQVLIARYQMTEQVYRHKIRRITDAMLQRAILDAASSDRGDLGLRKAFVFEPRNRSWLDAFLATDDAWLLERLARSPGDSAAGKALARVRHRQLPKEVYWKDSKDLPGCGATERERLERNRDLQRELEQRLAQVLGSDPDLTFLDIRARSNPLYRSPDVSFNEEILIIQRDKTDERLSDSPDSLCHSASVKPEARVYVYALLGDALPDGDGRRQYAGAESVVQQGIEEWFKEKRHAT